MPVPDARKMERRPRCDEAANRRRVRRQRQENHTPEHDNPPRALQRTPHAQREFQQAEQADAQPRSEDDSAGEGLRVRTILVGRRGMRARRLRVGCAVREPGILTADRVAARGIPTVRAPRDEAQQPHPGKRRQGNDPRGDKPVGKHDPERRGRLDKDQHTDGRGRDGDERSGRTHVGSVPAARHGIKNATARPATRTGSAEHRRRGARGRFPPCRAGASRDREAASA